MNQLEALEKSIRSVGERVRQELVPLVTVVSIAGAPLGIWSSTISITLKSFPDIPGVVDGPWFSPEEQGGEGEVRATGTLAEGFSAANVRSESNVNARDIGDVTPGMLLGFDVKHYNRAEERIWLHIVRAADAQGNVIAFTDAQGNPIDAWVARELIAGENVGDLDYVDENNEIIDLTGQSYIETDRMLLTQADIEALERNPILPHRFTIVFADSPIALTLDNTEMGNRFPPVQLNTVDNPDPIGMLEDFVIDYLAYGVNFGAPVSNFGEEHSPLRDDSELTRRIPFNRQYTREEIVRTIRGQGSADMRIWMNLLDLPEAIRTGEPQNRHEVVDLAQVRRLEFQIIPYTLPYNPEILLPTRYVVSRGGPNVLPNYDPRTKTLRIQIMILRDTRIEGWTNYASQYPMMLFIESRDYVLVPEFQHISGGENQAWTWNRVAQTERVGWHGMDFRLRYTDIDPRIQEFTPATWVPLFAEGPRH